MSLVGMRFTRLVVTERAPSAGNQVYWRCLCDCGETRLVKTQHLRGGDTKSCGCLKKDRQRALSVAGVAARKARAKPKPERKHRHGMSGSRSYKIWSCMRARCENPNHNHYSYYGGRGIAVCEQWKNFEGFLADMGEAPSGMTIERVDNDRGYEPGNCRWASRADQNRNTRRNRLLTYDGASLTISEWARRIGINEQTIASRIDDSGWTVADALTRPVANKRYPQGTTA
jgi:hypothetical protein